MEILLEEVLKRKASDLHLQVGTPPHIRVDGKLAPLANFAPLTETQTEAYIFQLMEDDQKAVLLRDKEFDFSFSFGSQGRFRGNAFYEKGNLAASLRLIPPDIRSVEALGLPPIVRKFANYPQGLVLITGPTGAGKSTTMAAIIDQINNDRAAHIVTIEDPIEYTHQSKKSLIVQREVHYDTFSFSAALRSSLREDPDIVMIGEMRDLETIASAITIAETGALVFAALHTNSAAQSVDRIVNVFPAYQQTQVRSQLSSVLMAICSQRLLPALAGGRVVATEVLIGTAGVRNIIREGKTHQLGAVIQTGAAHGMQSLERTLANLVHAGQVSYDEARGAAADPEELDKLMRS
ncbi:type IV pilus twitching motility protein PilT [Candidatus Saccharibacteria bacterium]|nr:type IV pilus twitching motility protein PilT [Candidatus Saccharibacteria bacterium]